MRRLLLPILLIAAGASAPNAQAGWKEPLPSVMPNFVEGDCPQFGAFPCYVNGTIYMWPKMLDGDPAYLRFIRMHELGHAFDDVDLDDGERHRFTHLAGLDGQPWQLPPNPSEETGAPGHEGSPEETFADTYADCFLGNPVDAALCRFIQRAAPARRGQQRSRTVARRTVRRVHAPKLRRR